MNKKVINLLSANPKTSAESTSFDYLQKYIRILRHEDIKTFLRFCTGADMLCAKQIKVSLSKLDGIKRRLIAHTCGPLLKVLQLTRTSGNSKENSIKPFKVVTGTWILYDKFGKYKVTLKGYGHSGSLLLLRLHFILRLVNIIPFCLVKLTNHLCRFYKMLWLLLKEISGKVFKSSLSKFCGRQAVFHKIYLVHAWIFCPI